MKPYAAHHAFWFWRQALPVAMLRVLAGGILAGGILAGAVSSLPAAAQTFAGAFGSEGPAPTFGKADIVQSRDAPPDGTTSGAVQAILANPANAQSIIIGSTNGGIWSTQNGGATWKPLTDTLPSLSIASLAYDSTASSVVFAGIGVTDNGAVGGFGVNNRGGARTGVLQSTDGGNSWTPLAASVQTALVGKSVVGVAGYGAGGSTTILAATYEPQGAAQATGANGYGLYMSVNGGNFQLVNNGASVLPAGAATSLVGQGTGASPYYVAITADTTANSGVFRSADGGLTWTRVLTTGGAGGVPAARLAIAPNGAVAVALFDQSTTGPTAGKVTGVQLSQDGTTWTPLNFPPVNSGSQASVNLSVAVDPNNTNIVYLAGDVLPGNGTTITAYRLTLQGGTTTIQQITDSGTVNNSTIHADSRAFAFSAGRLLLSSDGGIYALSNPQTTTGAWTSLNGNLSLREAYSVAYDAVSNRLLVAAQDTGAGYQNTPLGTTYSPVNEGDGVTAAINDRTYAASGQSILYSSSQSLAGLTRTVVNAQGTILNQAVLLPNPTATNPTWNFEPSDFGSDGSLPFFSLFVLNRNDPTKIAIGTNFAYVTTDAQIISGASNVLTNVGSNTSAGAVQALAYGASDNVNALLVGVNGSTPATRLYFSSTSAPGSLSALSNYAGAAPTSVVFGPRSSAFYVADGTDLWGSTNSGGTIPSLTSNLSSLNIGRPTAVEFIANNGVDALLVGGINNVATTGVDALSPIAVALSDGSGNLSGWSAFGRDLPNTIVNQLVYNPSADVLVAGLYGRGIWTLYDVTSYFATASVLQFGLANNDSTPGPSQLTGDRPLIKYGTGTLTITSDASYTGGTTINAGTMQIGNGGTAGSIIGDVTDNGTLAFNRSDIVTFPGVVSGTGALTQAGTGTTILTGANTYSGGTTIAAGTLQIGNGGTAGSIIGDVTDNGTLAFNRSDIVTFPGVVSGTGALIQAGSGTTILTGANTYAGGTTIEAGTLQIGNGGTSGSIIGNVTDNATLAFNRADTVTFPGVISGTGSVVQAGPGTLVLPGANSYGGGTTLASGTITVGNNGALGTGTLAMAAGTTLSFLGNTNLTLANPITISGDPFFTPPSGTTQTLAGAISDGSAPGTLDMSGAGTLVLSATNTYSGATNVNSGILQVNGSIATSGLTSVNNGGTLLGTGTVGNTRINGGGVFAPGAPGVPGTSTAVAGNLTFQPGSTYLVQATVTTASRANVSGTATLSGGTVSVMAQPGVYRPSTNYTILNAAGGVSGAFSGVTSNFAFLAPSLSYDPNDVFLTLQLTGFAAGAQTPNQYAVGTALDRSVATATGDFATVLSTLVGLGTQPGAAALNALSGQPWADFGTMNVNNSAMFMNALEQQMANARGVTGSGQRQALAQACEVEACDGTGPLSAWASALGGLGSVLGDGNASTLTYNFGGAAAGIDYRFDPRFLVGIGTGYTHGTQWVNSFMGQGWSDSVSFAAYGSFAQSGFYLDALAGYAYSNNQLQRQLLIPGLQQRTATGSTGANQFLGQIEGGYKVDVYAPAMASITPFGRFQISSVTQNAFSESGAQSLDLNVAQQTTNSQRTTIGADLASSIGLGNERKLDLAVRLGWQHEFADTGRPITAAFAGAPGNAFTVFGATPARNSAVVGLQASTTIAAATQAYLRYDGEVGGGTDNHALNVGLRMSW
jgi:autotransporter-associated beta strand protein